MSNHRNQFILGLISVLLISALVLTSAPVNAYHMSSLDKAVDQHSNAPFVLAVTQLLPPTNLVAEEVGDKTVVLTWKASSGAVKYNIYRSVIQSSYGPGDLIKPLVVTNPYMKMEYIDQISDLEIIKEYYYVVTAVDSLGVESALSNEVVAIPHHEIFWVGTVFPLGRPYNNQIIDPYTLGDPSILVRFAGEIDIRNYTNVETQLPDVWGQLGFGPAGDDPSSTGPVDLTQWTNWVDADFAGRGIYYPAVEHARYTASLVPDTPGKYYFTYRFSTDGGRSWVYSDFETTVEDSKGDPGHIVPGNRLWYMEVKKGSDVEPPALPTTFWKSPVIGKTSVTLSWNPSTAPDIYAYDLYRSTSSSFQGEQIKVKRILSTETYKFTDTGLTANSQYHYRITAYDRSFNPAVSKILYVKTLLSVVTVHIHVSIPRFTKDTIYINRKINPITFLPEGADWKGISPDVPCNFTIYTCDLTLKLQENSQFIFLFSRGSAQTVQTHLDGNSPRLTHPLPSKLAWPPSTG